jgi:hypothetical protein
MRSALTFPILNNVDTVHSDPWLCMVGVKHIILQPAPVHVITAGYERAHGRKPAGVALWQFELRRGETVRVYGAYAQAKQQAVRVARELHVEQIRVVA